MTDTDKLTQLIQEADVLFAPYRAVFPLNVCNCDGCMTEQEQRTFLAFRLHEIPATWLYSYLVSVSLDDTATTVAEMKHFLPRIAQAIVQREEIHMLHECTLARLHADRHDLWQPEESAWLNRFAAAWMLQVLAQPQHDGELLAMLEMFARAGLDIAALIAEWTRHAHRLSMLRTFVDIYLTIPYGSDEPQFSTDCEAADQAVKNWFARADTRARFHAAFEQALLAGREQPEETLLWEQCYDWLGARL